MQKERYYSLENVNLLLQLEHGQIEWFFGLMKRNVPVLKYQFKQLKIGINIDGIKNDIYQVIEWNPSVDQTFLDEHKALLDQNEGEFGREKNKYGILLNKWS